MGFFKNVGVSYEYLYDLMSFNPMKESDIGSYEQDPGDVVEKAIIKEKEGFCIKIRRERQKRARLLRFSYADIIRTIENETPNLKNEKISRIVFTSAYVHHTAGYHGKAIFMRIDFGDKMAPPYSSGDLWTLMESTIFAPIYQTTHQYLFGHKFLDIIS